MLEEIGYKPVSEWDNEELARGKPRNSQGSFSCPSPSWLTQAIQTRDDLRPEPPPGVRYLSPSATEMLFAIGAGPQVTAVDDQPGYPAELVDLVLTYAGRPIRTALEIGAGTGKATRLFAGAGVAVTATEPDAAMLAELRKHVPAGVETVRAAFEDLRPGARYHLVYAAAALHWTAPEGRWSRVAGLLEPGGVFASFGGPPQLADLAVADAVRAARAPFLESDEIPSPDGTPPGQAMQWPGTELQRSESFTHVQQTVIERRLTMSARDYVGYLSTVLAYLELPTPAQEQLFRQIEQILPETVELCADIVVHLARRRPDQ
ncbi:methyltransferase family protein [Micromonospora violae]|uniref:Methyltransferase family protein n=2 Tax=Micromonospora violae TaxID=1278207 RepID=A0A4Q7UAA9_9ACTN|nr:methyltransferase family protein [Micromonospora violae]